MDDTNISLGNTFNYEANLIKKLSEIERNKGSWKLSDACEDMTGRPIKYAALQTHEELHRRTSKRIKTFHLVHWLLSNANIKDTGCPINCVALRTQRIRGTGRQKELKKFFQIHHLLSDASIKDTGRSKELKKISQIHCLLSDASNGSTECPILPMASWLSVAFYPLEALMAAPFGLI